MDCEQTSIRPATSIQPTRVRLSLPELEGQPFFEWVDEVYDTGVHITRKAQLAYPRRPGDGFEDRYFDFICYPARDRSGKVYGVMVQAPDVTENSKQGDQRKS